MVKGKGGAAGGRQSGPGARSIRVTSERSSRSTVQSVCACHRVCSVGGGDGIPLRSHAGGRPAGASGRACHKGPGAPHSQER